MAFTVGELSRLTGITVRALRHYDELGLVSPSARTPAGYRLYDDGNVARLQQVLMLRELGVPLDEIAAAIEAPDDARGALLRQHRDALADKRARIDAMLAAVDRAIADLGQPRGDRMREDQIKQMFEGFDPKAYEEEARAQWGHTEAYKESARRTAGYGASEWAEIQREAAEIYARLAGLMQQGAAVTSPEVQAAVEAHRRHLDRWFYPCSVAMHRGVAEMYVSDPRFKANLDAVSPGGSAGEGPRGSNDKGAAGFAQFLRDAIAAS